MILPPPNFEPFTDDELSELVKMADEDARDPRELSRSYPFVVKRLVETVRVLRLALARKA